MAVPWNDGVKKMEGKFPSWLQAGTCGGVGVFGWFGLKPDLRPRPKSGGED